MSLSIRLDAIVSFHALCFHNLIYVTGATGSFSIPSKLCLVPFSTEVLVDLPPSLDILPLLVGGMTSPKNPGKILSILSTDLPHRSTCSAVLSSFSPCTGGGTSRFEEFITRMTFLRLSPASFCLVSTERYDEGFKPWEKAAGTQANGKNRRGGFDLPAYPSRYA